MTSCDTKVLWSQFVHYCWYGSGTLIESGHSHTNWSLNLHFAHKDRCWASRPDHRIKTLICVLCLSMLHLPHWSTVIIIVLCENRLMNTILGLHFWGWKNPGGTTAVGYFVKFNSWHQSGHSNTSRHQILKPSMLAGIAYCELHIDAIMHDTKHYTHLHSWRCTEVMQAN